VGVNSARCRRRAARPALNLILNISMDFEWDNSKELANRKKHGIDFRTAAKVFLDPHAIEFDDLDATDELRFNAIGLVDGRMLFVTYTLRRRHRSHHLGEGSRAA
jgi:uncharacterized DUF497 family protein